MSRWANQVSRREAVRAQYRSARDAANYARASQEASFEGRYFRSRLQLVQDVLAACPGGDLLDAGCGPGLAARQLLASRQHDFRIAVLDQSPAMVEYCVAGARDVGTVCPSVGRLEALPFAEASFDVTMVLGALEYTDIRAAIREITRVTKPMGLVIVTMLNPLNPYRFTEWFVYWPLRRLLGAAEAFIGVRAARRHGIAASGIRAFTAVTLKRLMRQAGLEVTDLVYYGFTPLIPPLYRVPALVRMTERAVGDSGEGRRSGSKRQLRWLGTAYLVTARRAKM